MTRKPWMDRLSSHRFTRDGCMTTATASAWRSGSDIQPATPRDYALALGISVDEAAERIARQEARLTVTEIQNDLFEGRR